MNTNLKIPKICCPKCNGSGRVNLGPELLSVLRAVKAGGLVTAVDLWTGSEDTAFVGPTAYNNRLNDLLALGLVKVCRRGKRKFYSVVEGKR